MIKLAMALSCKLVGHKQLEVFSTNSIIAICSNLLVHLLKKHTPVSCLLLFALLPVGVT